MIEYVLKNGCIGDLHNMKFDCVARHMKDSSFHEMKGENMLSPLDV